jgi:hypothetical protein
LILSVESLQRDGLAPLAQDGAFPSVHFSAPFLISVVIPVVLSIVLVDYLPLASVVLISTFSEATGAAPPTHVLGGKKSMHVGLSLFLHSGGVPAGLESSLQLSALVPPEHVGAFPSEHNLAPLIVLTTSSDLAGALPSLHVLGFLPSAQDGGLLSEHFPLTATPTVHFEGCFLSEHNGTPPSAHFEAPCLISIVSVLTLPVESMISFLTLTTSVARDPSLHSVGAFLSVHFPSTGLIPPVHNGKFPSEHCAAPLSTVLVSTDLEISTPSAHVDGFFLSAHSGPLAAAMAALESD